MSFLLARGNIWRRMGGGRSFVFPGPSAEWGTGAPCDFAGTMSAPRTNDRDEWRIAGAGTRRHTQQNKSRDR